MENHKANNLTLRTTDSEHVQYNQLSIPDFAIDEAYCDIYTKFEEHIKPAVINRKMSTIYRFQMNELSMDRIIDHLFSVFHVQSCAFKLAISLSYILKNMETDELVFYWGSQNNQKLIEAPWFIGKKMDLENLIVNLRTIDFQNHVIYPNSKFAFRKATNVLFYVTRLPNTPIGTTTGLPDFLKNNKGLISLVNNPNTGRPYSDNLCFFRCLALHRGETQRALETSTKELFRQYCHQQLIDPTEFTGVTLGQMYDLSNIFDVGILIYKLDESKKSELIYRSVKQDNVMHLNLFGNHFSFIKDFGKYSSCYLCTTCKRSFNRKWSLHLHLKTCDTSTRAVYGSGVFTPPPTIFDKLTAHGIEIPDSLRFYEHKIVFDIECLLTRDTGLNNTERVNYTFKHELASISVCSNITDYEDPICFISDGCPRRLLQKCIEYMTEIAIVAKIEQREKFAAYMEQIEELDDIGLVEKFDEYLSQVPVLSYNGGSYDIRVIKEPLISLLLQLDEVKFVIKRVGNYACIATESLKFLDVISYLAAGTSLDSFLKAFNARQNKSYFPYEYFNSLELLESQEFPPYDGFYSSLKQRNTLEPQKGTILSAGEIALIGRTPTKEFPLTDLEIFNLGRFRYNVLRETFIDNGWTMREFLEDYNNK